MGRHMCHFTASSLIIHHFLFYTIYISRTTLSFGISNWTGKLYNLPSVLSLTHFLDVKVGGRWSGHTGSEKCPWPWNCEEVSAEGGFSKCGPEYVLAIWRNRQSCSSPVSMATISGPTQVLVEVFCFSRGCD